jgi:hypothetical protein
VNAFCPFCRTVIYDGQGVVMGAFGRPWFTVHTGQCHEAVKAVLRQGALVALGALRTVLKAQSPGALKAVEGVAAGLKLFRGLGAPPRG